MQKTQEKSGGRCVIVLLRFFIRITFFTYKSVLELVQAVLNTGLIAANHHEVTWRLIGMTRGKKIAGLTVAVLAIVLIVAVSISVQAEPQIKTTLDAPVLGGVAVAGSNVTQSGVAQPAYPVRQSEKTIQFTSMVQDVDVTGFVITSDSQVKVSVDYTGTGKSPPITVIVSTQYVPMLPPYVMEPTAPTPAPGSAEKGSSILPGYYPNPYLSLIGSNVMKGGWSSATDVTLGLVGNGTIYDATSIQVLIIPYTGSS